MFYTKRELAKRIERLEAEAGALPERVAELERKVAELEARMRGDAAKRSEAEARVAEQWDRLLGYNAGVAMGVADGHQD
jgi:predicted nuclease with TOPRIM domain